MDKFIRILLLVLIHTNVFSEKKVLVHKNNAINISGSFIQTLEDSENKFTINDIIHAEFSQNNKDVPNFGISNSAFWLKFEIHNLSNQNNLLLYLAYPNLNEVEFYSISVDNKLAITKMGKYMPFFQRKYHHPGYLFDLNIPYNKTLRCYLKIKSGGQIMAPISLGAPEEILGSLKAENLIIGIYIGIMLVMFFYNLFIYFVVRDKVYLYYVGYILIVGLVQLCLLGYTFQYIWPNSTWLAIHSVYLLSALVGIGAIEFVKVFLQTKTYDKRLHSGFLFFNLVYVLYMVLDLFNFSAELYAIIQLCALFLSVYLIIIAYRISKKGYRPARFFLLAWSVFLIGVFVYALKDVGILPYNNYTVYIMPVGSAFETILLSFALADRINILKKEKEDSIAIALQLSQENERIIKEQNTNLEIKVKERTAELEASNKSLKEAEAILINTEKMASLGQLTAGISHEINNPINFVVSNIKPLKRDIEEILIILSKYDEIKEPQQLKEKLNEIKTLKEKFDSDYLVNEINQLLKGIDEGAQRTAEIVKGLKYFSRADEGEKKITNINEGIEATLTLLNNSIVNGNIKVVKNFGNIPEIECFPGKLNQVFMNLLTNAIHAIALSGRKKNEGELYIMTTQIEKNILITISDNGIGIPANIISKIFEPFFTTKDIGEGTGLGLSIVYGIIKSHQGKIEVTSELNKKTTFTITLPIV